MALANLKEGVPAVGDVLSAVSWKNDHVGVLHFKSGKDIEFCVRHPDIVEQAVVSTPREVKVCSDAKEFFGVGDMPHHCHCRERYEEKVETPTPEVGHGSPS